MFQAWNIRLHEVCEKCHDIHYAHTVYTCFLQVKLSTSSSRFFIWSTILCLYSSFVALQTGMHYLQLYLRIRIHLYFKWAFWTWGSVLIDINLYLAGNYTAGYTITNAPLVVCMWTSGSWELALDCPGNVHRYMTSCITADDRKEENAVAKPNRLNNNI